MANRNDVITVTGISASVDVQDVPVPGVTDIIGGYQPINLFNNVTITDSNPNALLGAVIIVGGNGGLGSLSGFAISQFSPDAGTYFHTTQSFTAAQLTAIFDSASFDPGGHENRGANWAIASINIFEGSPQPGTLVASYVAPPNVPSTFASISFTEIPPPTTIDPNGIKVSYSPPEGGIVDGSTTHPLSGILVTDSNAQPGVAISETATVGVFYDAGEPGSGTQGPRFTFSAASPGELTNELQGLLYTASNADPGQSTQFEVNVTDGFTNSTYAFDVPNESPSIVQPGPPVPPPLPPAVTEVTQFYQGILQRSPDPGGLAYWTGEINSGAMSDTVAEQNIINSSEAQDYVVPIVEMYAILGRAPDQAGLNGWVHALEGGASLPGIALAFISSPEGQGIYGAVPTAGSSVAVDTAFTTGLYENILGRAPDTGGLGYWVNQLQDGLPAQNEALGFIQSTEAQSRFGGGSNAVNSWLAAAGDGTFNPHLTFGSS
jgi:Domain of unknown function (DUF4214)